MHTEFSKPMTYHDDIRIIGLTTRISTRFLIYCCQRKHISYQVLRPDSFHSWSTKLPLLIYQNERIESLDLAILLLEDIFPDIPLIPTTISLKFRMLSTINTIAEFESAFWDVYNKKQEMKKEEFVNQFSEWNQFLRKSSYILNSTFSIVDLFLYAILVVIFNEFPIFRREYEAIDQWFERMNELKYEDNTIFGSNEFKQLCLNQSPIKPSLCFGFSSHSKSTRKMESPLLKAVKELNELSRCKSVHSNARERLSSIAHTLRKHRVDELIKPDIQMYLDEEEWSLDDETTNWLLHDLGGKIVQNESGKDLRRFKSHHALSRSLFRQVSCPSSMLKKEIGKITTKKFNRRFRSCYVGWKDRKIYQQSVLFRCSMESKYSHDLLFSVSSKSSMENSIIPHKFGCLRSRSLTSLENMTVLESNLGGWDIDFVSLNPTHTNLLMFTCLYFMDQTNLISAVWSKIDMSNPKNVEIHYKKVINFFEKVENGYDTNVVYHNSTHAADVVNSVFYLYQQLTEAPTQGFNPSTHLELFTAIVAGAIHDIGHTGQNNKYHVVTQSNLAIRYSDQSVLEMFHLANAFEISRHEESNIFFGLSKEDYLCTREWIIDAVLSTDLSKHLSIVCNLETQEHENMKTNQRLSMVLKIADIGHAFKPIKIHQKWSYLIAEEMYRQGDLEKSMKLTISPFMNRETDSIAKSQIGFFEYVASPLIQAIRSYFSNISYLEECMEENLNYWEKMVEKEKQKEAYVNQMDSDPNDFKCENDGLLNPRNSEDDTLDEDEVRSFPCNASSFQQIYDTLDDLF